MIIRTSSCSIYFGMYRVAPGSSRKSARHSIAQRIPRRAYGTAVAMFTDSVRGRAVVGRMRRDSTTSGDPRVIAALEDEGMPEQADRLRTLWERKVRAFFSERPDLFGSEYAFDSTGFEVDPRVREVRAGARSELGRERPASERAPAIPVASTRVFLEQQMDANIFCRGLARAGVLPVRQRLSRIRRESYTLTYMSAMGGWSVLDYALDDRCGPCAVPAAWLRLVAQLLGAAQLRDCGIEPRLLVSRHPERRRRRRGFRARSRRDHLARAAASSRIVVLLL